MGSTKRTGAADDGGNRGLTPSVRLRQVADQRGDDVFVVSACGNRTISYAEFDDLVGRTAAVLASLGAGRGNAVHLQLPNTLEHLVCLLAINRTGATAVPVSPAATVDDVAYITSHAGCRISVVDDGSYELVDAAREMAPDIRHVVSVGVTDGDVDLAAERDAVSPFRTSPDPAETELAAILYTSGTTGWPKGVMLTHRNLMFAGDAVASHLRIRPDDRWLITLPLSHMNGLGYSAMSALSAGASIALVEQFDPESWATTVRASGATLGSLFAVHARRILASDEHKNDADNQLRILLFAQHLSSSERATFERRFAVTPLQVYGLTETIAPTIADPTYGEHRADTIGQPTVWTSVKLIDRAGKPVPDGAAGELVVGGEPGRSLMSGYHQRPDETRLVMRDGWLRTGDQMVKEPDGSFRFLGRAVDLIKPGADNVSAPEVERVLLEHVSVADAAVVGVQKESGDEIVVAFVVLHPDEDATPDEILGWAAERLARFKVPERLLLVDSLPRNAVGKVLKRELRRLGERTV